MYSKLMGRAASEDEQGKLNTIYLNHEGTKARSSSRSFEMCFVTS